MMMTYSLLVVLITKSNYNDVQLKSPQKVNNTSLVLLGFSSFSWNFRGAEQFNYAELYLEFLVPRRSRIPSHNSLNGYDR